MALEVETFTIETFDKIVEQKVLVDKVFPTVIIKNYGDSHGHKVPWKNDNGKTQETLHNVRIKLEHIVKETRFSEDDPDEKPLIHTYCNLYIDGRDYPCLTITSAKESSKALTIQAMLGQG